MYASHSTMPTHNAFPHQIVLNRICFGVQFSVYYSPETEQVEQANIEIVEHVYATCPSALQQISSPQVVWIYRRAFTSQRSCANISECGPRPQSKHSTIVCSLTNSSMSYCQRGVLRKTNSPSNCSSSSLAVSSKHKLLVWFCHAVFNKPDDFWLIVRGISNRIHPALVCLVPVESMKDE